MFSRPNLKFYIITLQQFSFETSRNEKTNNFYAHITYSVYFEPGCGRSIWATSNGLLLNIISG